MWPSVFLSASLRVPSVRPNAELVDPGDDIGPANLGEVDGAGGFVERNGASGEDTVEMNGKDGGEDVPDLGPGLPGEFDRPKVAAEKKSGGSVWHSGQVGAGEGGEEGVGLLDAARRDDRGAASGMVEPGEGEGMEPGPELGAAVKQGERFVGSADKGAMGAESFGFGIALPQKAKLDAAVLVAGVELFAGGNALGIVWRGIEVKGADLGEIEHGISVRGKGRCRGGMWVAPCR